MKKLSKLSLNALKENAENVLNKHELKSINGGYQYCSGPWGGGAGYTIACYQGSTFLGNACTGGTCSGEEESYCASQGHPTTTYAYCI